MKRNLIGLAAVVLALAANAALADNNYVFDDAYWKQAPSIHSVQSSDSTPMRSKYDHVDGYNN